MDLIWQKCQGEVWCPFMTVDLSHSHFLGMEGVYIIWHGGANPKTVYVGMGQIANRIRAHRNDVKVTKYLSEGTMFVTWSQVARPYQPGVEAYLINTLRPLENVQRGSLVVPQVVNLPWT